MDVYGFLPIPCIAIICYVLAELVKAIGLDKKWLPVLCLVGGGASGIVGLFVIPGFPYADILNAFAVGVVSGGAATTVHQVFRQLGKAGETKDRWG